MPAFMKALVTAIPNTAIIQDVLIPEPGPKEVRVKVHAVGLNPVDALYVINPPCGPGRTIGSDIAGTVDKIGVEVTTWNVGDRIAGLLQGATTATERPGGFAEYAILEEDLAIRIPDRVSFEEAATLPLCSLTAAQVHCTFYSSGTHAPFPNPFKFDASEDKPPTMLIYSAATSLGLFAIGLLNLLRTSSGSRYRIFATASPKNFQMLKNLGVEAVFDYKSPTWPQEVREASGGISYAFDCISEGYSTALVSQTYATNGNLAVVRKYAWNRDRVREGVMPLYSAVWSGLGHEITYNNTSGSSLMATFSVNFFKFLSTESSKNRGTFPVNPIPVRRMPGGLSRILQEGLQLMSPGKNSDYEAAGKEWMRPVSGEKLVYGIGSY